MRRLLIPLGLVAVTLAVYGQVGGFEFVSWDDPLLVTDNPHVRAGLTVEGAAWALTTGHAGNWQPLTWLSHMADCQLWGLRPAGHHLTSVALHVANTLVLYAVLARLTAAPWASAWVAAAFAVHPLHVESVAWVAERKDVLSTLFGLLSLAAWTSWARHGGRGRYAAAALLLGLGLLAKPMLVTLPFVFLLLDYWPLGRLEAVRVRALVPLVREKLPLLALVVASSVITYLVQQGAGAMEPGTEVPLAARAANAIVSCVRYLGKAVWPVALSPLYPHPNLPGGVPWTAAQVAGAAATLAALSAVVLRAGPRPARVGWLWFLGMLAPVIGLVQVGPQAMADRYTYLPLVGLLVAVAWTGMAAVAARPRLGSALAAAAAATVLALLLSARTQTRHWRDSIALYERALAVSPAVPAIHYNLANALKARGRLDEAIRHYRAALAIEGDYADVRYNLANALKARGDTDAAIAEYEAAIGVRPRFAAAHVNLGGLLLARGRLAEATAHYRDALEIDPDLAPAHVNLAIALEAQGRPDEAAEHYRRALALTPGDARAHNNLGTILAAEGRLADAVAHFREALRLRPGYTRARQNLDGALARAAAERTAD